MKKIMAIVLTCAALIMTVSGIGVTASEVPAGTPISTVEEFINMSDSGVYYLANDIDFSGKTYTSNVYSKTFKGVLDGNGHALLGITIQGKNTDAGIFGNRFCGTLKNLALGSEEAPVQVSSTGGGFSVAAIAGTMSNGATLDNVTVYADVKGDGKTSGITSFINEGKVNVNATKVYGSITGNPASGFFALSNDYSADVTITNSFNYATVTGGSSSAGGFYTVKGSTSGTRSGTVTITGSANFGDITASDWRVGGIVGEFHEHLASKLTVDFCYNMGAITMTGAGGFAAGIVGGACFNAPSGKRTISNVYNGGEVKNLQAPLQVYHLAYARYSSNNVTMTNGVYLMGTPSENIKTENVISVHSIEELTASVTGFAASAEGNYFVASSPDVNDGYPILAHEAVSHENLTTYACGRQECLDCGKIISDPKTENHTFVKETFAPSGYVDGYETATCTACGYVTLEKGTPSSYAPLVKDGIYEITTSDHLRWYQANLDAGVLNGGESLALTADIDMKNEAFMPIGSEAHPFGGKFNGKGHTISNLKITTEDNAGLFGVISLGAEIGYFEVNGADIESDGVAGAVFGSVTTRAIVKLEWIALNNVRVTSANSYAGALGGSTEAGLATTVSYCVANASTVKGQYAGGLVGFGNSLDVFGSFANAKVQGKSNSCVGTLAYYTSGFNQKNSGYVKNGDFGKKNGTEMTEEEFKAGKATYLMNTIANKSTVGMDGDRVVFGMPTYGILNGMNRGYTSLSLYHTGDLEVYTDGKTVAIAVKRASDVKLPDLKITLKDKASGESVEVKFSDLTLTRRVTLGEKLYSVDSSTALYTLSLANIGAYEIGTFTGNAVTK